MKLTLYILCFFCIKLQAQNLSLQKAISIALQNNYEIQIAKNGVEINRINNDLAIAGGKPTVNGTVNEQENLIGINQKLNNGTIIKRGAVGSNNINANVTATMLLYNGYRVLTTKKRLEELQKQSEQIVNVEIQNCIENVTLKYFEIVRQQSYIKTLQQSIQLTQTQIDIINTKQNLGLANNANLYQAQIDMNSRLQEITTQEFLIKQAKIDLLDLLNLKADSNITISDTIIIDKNIVLENILSNIKSNPILLTLEQQIKINEFIEKETLSLNKPSIRANTGMNFGRTQSGAGQLLLNQSYGPFISIGLTVPLYNAGTVKRQAQVANINTKTAKLQLQNTTENLETLAIKAFQNYITNSKLVESQKSNLQLTQKLMDLSLERFRLGAATIIEVREAQKSFEDASFKLVNLNQAAKIAEINLKRIGGLLGDGN